MDNKVVLLLTAVLATFILGLPMALISAPPAKNCPFGGYHAGC
jgi:hypothetical protein